MAAIVNLAHPRLLGWSAAIAIVSSLCVIEAGQGSTIRADEHVMFFPSFAVEGNGASWTAHVHGWIYEPETGDDRDGLSRALGELIARRFGLSREAIIKDSVEAAQRFERRSAPFFVDNERGKRVAVMVGGARGIMEESEENGHFEGTVTLPAGAGTAGEWVDVRAILRSGDARVFGTSGRGERRPAPDQPMNDPIESGEAAAARQQNDNERCRLDEVLVDDQVAAFGGDRVEVPD